MTSTFDLVDPPKSRYVPDPSNAPWSLDFIEHLDGIPHYEAPPPPREHECWAQTRGFMGDCFARCPCGGISMDRPYEIKAYGNRSWGERCQQVAEPEPKLVTAPDSLPTHRRFWVFGRRSA